MIPKVVHQIWGLKGTNEQIPEDIAGFIARNKVMNPGWDFKMWTPENLPVLRNQRYYDVAENCGEKADISRYEIMEQFGGVYMDTDVLLYRSLDDITANREVLLYTYRQAEEETDADYFISTCVQNAFMASDVHNPFFTNVIDMLPIWILCNGEGWQEMKAPLKTVYKTGPVFLTRALQRLVPRYDSTSKFFGITTYSGVTVMPYRSLRSGGMALLNKGIPDYPEHVDAGHFWHGGWQ